MASITFIDFEQVMEPFRSCLMVFYDYCKLKNKIPPVPAPSVRNDICLDDWWVQKRVERSVTTAAKTVCFVQVYLKGPPQGEKAEWEYSSHQRKPMPKYSENKAFEVLNLIQILLVPSCDIQTMPAALHPLAQSWLDQAAYWMGMRSIYVLSYSAEHQITGMYILCVYCAQETFVLIPLEAKDTFADSWDMAIDATQPSSGAVFNIHEHNPATKKKTVPMDLELKLGMPRKYVDIVLAILSLPTNANYTVNGPYHKKEYQSRLTACPHNDGDEGTRCVRVTRNTEPVVRTGVLRAQFAAYRQQGFAFVSCRRSSKQPSISLKALTSSYDAVFLVPPYCGCCDSDGNHCLAQEDERLLG